MLNSVVRRSWTDADGLLSGLKWGEEGAGTGVTLTYSFPKSDANLSYSDISLASRSGLNSAQQDAFRQVLNGWGSIANINFVEVNDGQTYGDIRIGFSEGVNGKASGITFTLANGSRSGFDHFSSDDIAGDIWLATTTNSTDTGSFDVHVVRHEVGHALGLKHSFESSFDIGYFPKVSSYKDHVGYTVMSYTERTSAGYRNTEDGNWEVIYPSTPMIYDILAVQYLYGANMSTAVGDTTYTFSTQGEFLTIWDAGGNDTIDLSNQKTGSWFDLTPGTLSDAGLALSSTGNSTYDASFNIGIAFDCWIENIIGTSHDDTLWGNTKDNQITGGSGDDYLNGDSGIDTALYSGNRNQYTITKSAYYTYVEGAEGKDRLSNIEMLNFNGKVMSIEQALNSTSKSTPAPTSRWQLNFSPDENDTAWFLLELNEALSVDAQVHFSTRDGTAIAGEDYIATSGTAIIKAGETQTAISVDLIDDQITEDDETFNLVVTDPIGGTFGDGAIELTATRTIIDNDLA